MNEDSVQKLAEFIGKTSTHLEYITNDIKRLNGKVDKLILEVDGLDKEVKSHPRLCPINDAEVKKIINEQIELAEAKRPEKNRNKMLVGVSIFLGLLNILLIVKDFFNK